MHFDFAYKAQSECTHDHFPRIHFGIFSWVLLRAAINISLAVNIQSPSREGSMQVAVCIWPSIYSLCPLHWSCTSCCPCLAFAAKTSPTKASGASLNEIWLKVEDWKPSPNSLTLTCCCLFQQRAFFWACIKKKIHQQIYYPQVVKTSFCRKFQVDDSKSIGHINDLPWFETSYHHPPPPPCISDTHPW